MSHTFQLRLKIYKYTIIVMCIIAACIAIFADDFIPLIYGLVFGTLISILNFTLLAKTLEKAVYMMPHKAKMYASSQYFIRYIIYGIVIYISLKADYINILGTIIGLLMVKGVILATNLFSNKQYYKNIFKRREDI